MFENIGKTWLFGVPLKKESGRDVPFLLLERVLS